MQQINIVISGFTPYEGIDVNPAVLVPAAVAKQWADPAQSQAISEELLQDIAVTVTNVTLPVSFAKAWPTLKETIEATKPSNRPSRTSSSPQGSSAPPVAFCWNDAPQISWMRPSRMPTT